MDQKKNIILSFFSLNSICLFYSATGKNAISWRNMIAKMIKNMKSNNQIELN